MGASKSPFLTAEWRHLAMLNYEIDPGVLRTHVPAGTELDEFEGKTFFSLVGFLFLDTRVLGIPIPFHRNFEEVNLRFYVRRLAPEGWRRGVVFIKEIVPKSAIAWVARTLYGENYEALRMDHKALAPAVEGADRQAVSYSWWSGDSENSMAVEVEGAAQSIVPGSQQEFIAEHYWGYSRRRDGKTTEYQVEHPSWKVWEAATARLDCDVAAVYGKEFAEFTHKPATAFLALGSEISVGKGRLLDLNEA